MTTPVSAAPRVAARLSTAPAGPRRVVHASPLAVYVDLDGLAVGVLAAGAVQVPCGLGTTRSHLGDPTRAEVRDGVLHLDGDALVVGRLRGVGVPALRCRPTIASMSPSDVDHLVGRGPGLTPYGDDVVAGWLSVQRAAGVATPEVDAAVRAALPRTGLVSATLLDAALHGECVPELGRLLAALDTDAEPDARAALRAVGGTSGAGLLEGLDRALAPTAAVA